MNFNRIKQTITILWIGCSLSSHVVYAKTYEILMLDRDPDNSKRSMVFSPKLLKINVGDRVKFIATNSGHNSQSDDSTLPQGAQAWNSPIGKDFEITFTHEGTYSYFCTPHRAMGMVGLIMVGDYQQNWQQVKASKQPGKAKIYLNQFYEQIEQAK